MLSDRQQENRRLAFQGAIRLKNTQIDKIENIEDLPTNRQIVDEIETLTFMLEKIMEKDHQDYEIGD